MSLIRQGSKGSVLVSSSLFSASIGPGRHQKIAAVLIGVDGCWEAHVVASIGLSPSLSLISHAIRVQTLCYYAVRGDVDVPLVRRQSGILGWVRYSRGRRCACSMHQVGRYLGTYLSPPSGNGVSVLRDHPRGGVTYVHVPAPSFYAPYYSISLDKNFPGGNLPGLWRLTFYRRSRQAPSSAPAGNTTTTDKHPLRK